MSEAMSSDFPVDRGAPAFASAAATLSASPDTVWALLSDIEGWARWNSDVKHAGLEGPLAPDSHFVWKAGPGTIRSILRVVEPPRRIGWTGRTMGIRAVHVWEIEAADGGSRVRTEESWDGFIVRLLRPMMQKQLQKAMDASIAHLTAAVSGRRDAGD